MNVLMGMTRWMPTWWLALGINGTRPPGVLLPLLPVCLLFLVTFPRPCLPRHSPMNWLPASLVTRRPFPTNAFSFFFYECWLIIYMCPGRNVCPFQTINFNKDGIGTLPVTYTNTLYTSPIYRKSIKCTKEAFWNNSIFAKPYTNSFLRYDGIINNFCLSAHHIFYNNKIN